MNVDTPETREISPADALEAAIDWWREAGVEDEYREECTNWLAEPGKKQAVTSPPPKKPPEELRPSPIERAFESTTAPPLIGGPQEAYPDTLENFRVWWMGEKSLSSAGPERRLPPRGVGGAKVMVIIPEPFEGHGDSLLSGPPGRFVEAILRAMRVEPHEAYLASALPAPMALADWQDLADRGLASVTRHHVALAEPHRVIAFDRALAPIFGVTPALAREPATISTSHKTLPLMLAPSLDELARSPQRRRSFWNRWLDWTA